MMSSYIIFYVILKSLIIQEYFGRYAKDRAKIFFVFLDDFCS